MTGLGPAERLSANDVTPGIPDVLAEAGTGPRRSSPRMPGVPWSPQPRLWREVGRRPCPHRTPARARGRPHTIVGVLPDQFLFGSVGPICGGRFPFSSIRRSRESRRVGVVARSPRASRLRWRAALDDISRTSSPPASVRATRSRWLFPVTRRAPWAAGARGRACRVDRVRQTSPACCSCVR